MERRLLQVENILKAELEYAISRWGRCLHVTELELALQLVHEMYLDFSYVTESV